MSKDDMAYQISEETMDRTNECSRHFACLNGDNWDPCSIDSSLRGNFLIVKNRCNNQNCAYSVLLGYSYYFCKCPVRYEIYQRYHK